MPDFRDNDSSETPFDGEHERLGEVGIGKRTVTTLAFETRKPRILSVFDTTKKGLVCLIKTAQGVLKNVDGGTLFLDEIGDMPVGLQSKLLRVLEDGTVTPIGGAHQKHLDVRILAATNADLQKKIADGTFRRDLYFRLARFTVNVPPLRERPEDIPLLAEHFLNMFAAEMGISRGMEGWKIFTPSPNLPIFQPSNHLA
ncbi:sigma-54-dependent Fis family transcriptional regulator [Candidatus Poribacteria bacterium]|nr:sigma-54-dependent Fis family transcriptional regulator [Candidatus Poribacteria bacterium]